MPDALSSVVPSRTTNIELTGFPLKLGLAPSFSPVVMCATVASRETECEGRWGPEHVFLAAPVVADGVSGGPVFESREDSAELIVVGMYVGYVLDKSGPKLARIVPSRLIRELLEKPEVPE